MTAFGFTVAQIAAQLGLNASGVRAIIKARRLGCYRVGANGGRIRVTAEQLAAYLASTRQDVGTPHPVLVARKIEARRLPPVEDHFADYKARQARKASRIR